MVSISSSSSRSRRPGECQLGVCLHRPLQTYPPSALVPIQLAPSPNPTQIYSLRPPGTFLEPRRRGPETSPQDDELHFAKRCVYFLLRTGTVKMPPKGTAAVKAKVTRLPPLPHLRVKTPNIANARPCNTVMASVLSTPSQLLPALSDGS